MTDLSARAETFEEAKSIIINQIKSSSSKNNEETLSPILRFQVETGPLDLFEWLAVQDNKTKLYWSARDESEPEMAGTGIADEVFNTEIPDCESTFEHIQHHLSDEFPYLRYYGGFAFNKHHIDEDWETFGICRFIIPRFEVLRHDGRTYLACNLRRDAMREEIETVTHQLKDLDFTGTPEFKGPGKLVSRRDLPGHDEWVENLERVIDEIKRGEYKKTVLARKVILEFEKRQDPVGLLWFLKKLPSRRYGFLYQFDGERAFLGSSPEQLYKRSGREITSNAIAGTRSRGSDTHQDQLLARELLNSGKDIREHDFVVEMIENRLSPLCERLEVERDKGILKLKEVQHLISGINGKLKPGVTDRDLVLALHPTPAVGGTPLDRALGAIASSESFKRGWYAGALGVVGPDGADFCVGLRSGMTYENKLTLYSGVGIVEGSLPESEWQEVESKLTNFLELINGTPR